MRGRHLAVAFLAFLAVGFPRIHALDPPQVYHEGLPNLSVLSFAQDRQGYMWIGTGEGLVRFDGVRFRVFDRGTVPQLRSNAIMALAASPHEDRLWIGTFRGITLYAGGRFSLVATEKELLQGYTRQLIVDHQERLWIVTSEGLAHLEEENGNNQRIVTYPATGELPNAFDGMLLEDRGKRFWSVTSKAVGWIRDDNGELTLVDRTPDGMKLNAWSQLAEDEDGRLWLSAADGLWIYESDRFQPVRRSLNMPATLVNNMLATADMGFFFATSQGLFHLAENTPAAARVEGIQSDWIARLFRDRDGDVWAGGLEGMARWPAPDATRETPPVFLEEVIVDGRTQDAESPLVLPAGTRRLAIRYTAIRFEAPEDVLFRYRMDDEAWNDDEGARLVTYTNLKPGRYRFVVTARERRDDDVVESTPAELLIEVRPAYYQTWTFRGVVLFFAILLFRGLHKLRLRPVKRRQDELLQLKKKLRKKNDELLKRENDLQRLTYVTFHDLRNPLFTIQGFLGFLDQDAVRQDAEAVHGDLAQVREAVVKMEDLIEQLLLFTSLTPSLEVAREVALPELAAAACRRYQQRIRENGVELTIGDLPTVFGNSEQLAEVFRDLVDNALKFLGDAETPRIEISARHVDSEVVICSVKDNGIGIDSRYHQTIFRLFDQLNPEIQGHGVGLAMAQRIVELHGGRIWVDSNGPGAGSTFSFSLPTEPSASGTYIAHDKSVR